MIGIGWKQKMARVWLKSFMTESKWRSWEDWSERSNQKLLFLFTYGTKTFNSLIRWWTFSQKLDLIVVCGSNGKEVLDIGFQWSACFLSFIWKLFSVLNVGSILNRWILLIRASWCFYSNIEATSCIFVD